MYYLFNYVLNAVTLLFLTVNFFSDIKRDITSLFALYFIVLPLYLLIVNIFSLCNNSIGYLRSAINMTVCILCNVLIIIVSDILISACALSFLYCYLAVVPLAIVLIGLGVTYVIREIFLFS